MRQKYDGQRENSAMLKSSTCLRASIGGIAMILIKIITGFIYLCPADALYIIIFLICFAVCWWGIRA